MMTGPVVTGLGLPRLGLSKKQRGDKKTWRGGEGLIFRRLDDYTVKQF